MKQRTKEWIEKAEGDWKIAQREARTQDPVWDGVCFHAQQSAEKYLKAFWEEQNIPFPKTHDLVVLIDLRRGALPELDTMRANLTTLTTFGVAPRYPGVFADKPAGEHAMRTAQKVRDVVRAKLGLP